MVRRAAQRPKTVCRLRENCVHRGTPRPLLATVATVTDREAFFPDLDADHRLSVTKRHGNPKETQLASRHARVLGYLSLYLDRWGHLPTHSELAEACRLRSSSTAHGVVRDLERFGLLRRNEANSRLATLPYRIAPADPVDETDHWLLLRVLELQTKCELEWTRDGLSLTADLMLLDWMLQRAQQHLSRLRSYEHIRVLLPIPDAQAQTRLNDLEAVMSGAAQAYQPLKANLDTWFTYSAMGNVATSRISENISSQRALTALHLSLDLDADFSKRNDWRFCAGALERGDLLVEESALQISQISDDATSEMRSLLSRDVVEVVPVHAATIDDLMSR
ncbi:MAG: LexA binding domain [Ilumatobacteraceae bacterium]|nr:LexA binding domain [Ilumatobacteraceae bacterium]